MKLDHTLEIPQEKISWGKLVQYQKIYKGTLLSDYITCLRNKTETLEEENALDYGVQAMLKTGKEEKKPDKMTIFLDANRALQVLKMWRKGFQDEMRRKEAAWAREEAKMSAGMERLEQEWKELSEIREQAREQAMVGNIRKAVRESGNGDRNRVSVREDSQMKAYEKKYMQYRTMGILFLIVGALIGIFLIPFPWILLEIAGIVVIEFGLLSAARSIKEEQYRYKKQKIRERKRLEALMGNLEEIQERMRLKEKQIRKLQEKYEEFRRKTEEKQPEEIEMDALSLAIQILSELEGEGNRGAMQQI